MTTVGELREYCAAQKKLHPNLASEIQEFYQLAIDEIEDGGYLLLI